jgi:ketosteroid isomerase-like protein
MGDARAAELASTLQRYLAYRHDVDEGKRPWSDLADFFVDDAVFIDPAWGRIEGLDDIRAFLVDSMTGIEDWTFPVDRLYVDGDEVVVKFRQVLPGSRPDGSPIQQSGYSTLLYAGGGKFRYEEDVLNMAHVFEDLRAIGFQAPEGMQPPPRHPTRDFRRPG